MMTKNLFRRCSIVRMLAHGAALWQCWRIVSGKERDAWRQGMPDGMLIP